MGAVSDDAVAWGRKRHHGELSADKIVTAKRRAGRVVEARVVCDGSTEVDHAQSLADVVFSDEGITWRVLSVPALTAYGYDEYDSRRRQASLMALRTFTSL